LLYVEMRRALHRRVVHVLIALALIACALAGVIAFVDSAGKSLAELHANGSTHPAVMRDWWLAGNGDSSLLLASFFLLLGAFFGGASVAGAEWRAGSVATVLTWSPSRLRMHGSRTAACAILAALISFALQGLFLLAFLPAAVAHGSTAGTTAGWWASLTLAMVRTSLLTAIAATLGVALATLGRNTAFAVISVFTWLTVVEGIVRANKPGLARYLWGENVATAVPWAQMENAPFRRGPLLALITVTAYVVAISIIATITFARRDIASAS
jgi:hypothetical protein